MISTRPFQAHQFALLHLLGLLSISRPQESANPDERHDSPEYAGLLQLPQEVLVNAYCYLTEQIHEVTKPHSCLEQLLEDVYNLTAPLLPPTPTGALDTQVQSTKSTRNSRRTSTRSPTKRASTSPAANTRSLRRSTSRTAASTSTDASHPPASAKSSSTTRLSEDSTDRLPPDPAAGDASQPPAFLVNGAVPDRTRGTYPLVERLYTNVVSDIGHIKEDRSDALFAGLPEFRVLLGDLDNPNSVGFLDRSSPLGLWLRRALLDLSNMAFAETEELIEDLLVWAGVSNSPKVQTSDQGLFAVTNSSPGSSNTLQARTETFEDYQASLHTEDYSRSLDLMQQFFDFETFPLAGGPSANRGMRQHALLNLAHFHLSHEEYAAARLVAVEGMKVARNAGDIIAMNALTSALKKIAFEEGSDRPEYRDGGHADAYNVWDATKEDPGGYVPASDYLWDVRNGISTRVPLPILTADLMRAKALSYFAANQKTNLSSKERRKEKKLAAQQGKEIGVGPDSQQRRLKWNRLDTLSVMPTASDLWERMGCDDLATAYGIMARTTTSGDIDPHSGSRMAAVCQQALRMAQVDQYAPALCLLLAEIAHQTDYSPTVRDVQTWQRGVYAVIRIKAERSGNEMLLEDLERACPPSVVSTDFPRRLVSAEEEIPSCFPGFDEVQHEHSGLIGEVESLIRKVTKYLDMSQPAQAWPLSVKAVALSAISDGQSLGRLHLRAVLQVVRVQVALRTPDRALRILDDIWADILGTDDIAFRAYAQEIKAELLEVLVTQVCKERQNAGEEGQDALAKATVLLDSSAAEYEKLGMGDSGVKVLSRLAHLLHRREDFEARDAAASRCRDVLTRLQAGRSQAHRRQLTAFSNLQKLAAVLSANAAL